MNTFGFEKLEVYVDARRLVKDVYTITQYFPSEERYALTDQIHRAVVSVVSNIAEGTSRISNKDKAHFIEISYGSLMEVVAQLQIALDMGYINQLQYDTLYGPIRRISFELHALRQSYIKINAK